MNTQFDVLDEIVIGLEHYSTTNQDTRNESDPIHLCWNATGTSIAVSCVIDDEQDSDTTPLSKQPMKQLKQQQPNDLRKIRIYSFMDRNDTTSSTNTNSQQLVAIEGDDGDDVGDGNNVNDNDDDDDQQQQQDNQPSLLQLRSIGRNEDGLGKFISNIVPTSTIDWANDNTSNLLTSIQRKGPLLYQIIFLEPNGLRHGQFLVRTGTATNKNPGTTGSTSTSGVSTSSTEMKLIDIRFHTLRWNPITSDLLCIVFQEIYNKSIMSTTSIGNDRDDSPDNTTTTTTIVTKIQFYSRSNYYWYLKQEIRFDDTDTNTIWDVQFIRTNHIAVFKKRNGPSNTSSRTSMSGWIEYTFRWDVSTVRATNNSCLAFVMDGTMLHITNLQQAIIPPPMCGHKLIFDIPITDILLNYTDCCSSNDDDNNSSNNDSIAEIVAVLVLVDYSFVVLGYNKKDNKSRSYPKILARSDNTYLSRPCSGLSNNDSNVVIKSLYCSAVVQTTTTSVQTIGLASTTTMITSPAISSTSSSNVLFTCTIQLGDQLQQENISIVPTAVLHPWNFDEKQRRHNNTPNIITIVPWIDGGTGAVLELQDGTLLEYDVTSSTITNIPSSTSLSTDDSSDSHSSFLEPCLWISAIKHPSKLLTLLIDSDNHNDFEHRSRPPRLVMGMSTQGRLYCYDLMVSDSVSSYFVSLDHEYLCYTSTTPTSSTSQASRTSHVGRFVSLYDVYNFDPYQGPDEHRLLLDGYEPRNVERGARIIAILCCSNTVHNPYIVQMPRGNLEGIYPRALVLKYVIKLIQEASYKDAFIMMRKHKVDLNLIVDLNPTQFVQIGCKKLLEQVTNIDYLNLFISSLQNSDCTQTKFILPPFLITTNNQQHVKNNGRDDDNVAGTATGQQDLIPFDFTTKTSTVCQILRGIMTENEKNGINHNYLLPILSTYAKEQPPKLDEALLLIKNDALVQSSKLHMTNNNNNNNKPVLFTDVAQGSIRYLAFLADYELLFDTALQLYDYDMARAVARNSPKMDPKVYIPLLKRYKNLLPYYYARYEVDMRLKHYELALRNLYRSHILQEEVVSTTSTDGSTIIIDNSFLACMTLIEQYKLHRLGLELLNDIETSQGNDTIEPMKQKYRCQIMLSLGDSLLNDPKMPNPSAALSVYMAIENKEMIDNDRIIRAARQAHDWSTYFTLYMLQQQKQQDASEVVPVSNVATMAYQIADEIASVGESTGNKIMYRDAARIVLDYACYIPKGSGADSDGTMTIAIARAVEYLLSADAWVEATRICVLNSRQNDLLPKVIDAAVSYAYATKTDLNERRSILAGTYPRYIEVVQLRHDAILAGNADNDEQHNQGNDDTGSVFSLASNLSTTSASSLRSSVSNSSMTSTASNSSLSSVISAKSTTSFSLTGTEASLRHKSKYNQIGGNIGKKDRSRNKRNQEKKRNKNSRKKVQPGSEEELNGLCEILATNGLIDTLYSETISDTIMFLFRNQYRHLAEELYETYNLFCSFIDDEVMKKVLLTKNHHCNGQQAQELLVSPDVVAFYKMQALLVHDNMKVPSLRKDVTDLLSMFPKDVNNATDL